MTRRVARQVFVLVAAFAVGVMLSRLLHLYLDGE